MIDRVSIVSKVKSLSCPTYSLLTFIQQGSNQVDNNAGTFTCCCVENKVMILIPVDILFRSDVRKITKRLQQIVEVLTSTYALIIVVVIFSFKRIGFVVVEEDAHSFNSALARNLKYLF